MVAKSPLAKSVAALVATVDQICECPHFCTSSGIPPNLVGGELSLALGGFCSDQSKPHLPQLTKQNLSFNKGERKAY